MRSLALRTRLGTYHRGDSEVFLKSHLGRRYRGRVQFLLTSPLNSKKSYGNLSGDEYMGWFF
jgi:hypothetical protein